MSVAAGLDCRLVVGLEIHVQLHTRTKMFCGCAVEFGAPPNSRTCPVCLGHPGVLPVINRTAYEYAVRTALALNCEISRFTKWDRKSYYYPDLPKNYQISQYDLPLSHDGHIEVQLADGTVKRIRIRRAHLEEDAGKNIHDQPGCTQVDLNRAGTPLLEIVTEPDIHSAEEAGVLARELQQIVRYIGVSEADMQKGHMRFEPNINVEIQQDGRTIATPIIEVKNLNSFRALVGAIQYEFDRQVAEWQQDRDYTLAKHGKQNRGWDDARGVTVAQREKEEAHEYRYFPDPDLVPVVMDDAWLERIRATVPELPAARRRRFVESYGLSPADAATIAADRATAELFESAVRAGGDPRTLNKQFISFWARLANERGCAIGGLGVEARRLGELARITAEGTINATAAAAVAERMLDDSDGPARIAEKQGLLQTTDTGQVEAWVDEAIAANPKAVNDYQSGGKKAKKALGFLQGQVMQKSKGTAPPQVVREMLQRKLS